MLLFELRHELLCHDFGSEDSVSEAYEDGAETHQDNAENDVDVLVWNLNFKLGHN